MGRRAKDDPSLPENRILPPEAFNPDYWYVAVSKPRKEYMVEALYREKGLESYCPRTKPRRKARSRKPDLVPLFPRYVFLHLNDAHQCYVASWTPGVLKLLQELADGREADPRAVGDVGGAREPAAGETRQDHGRVVCQAADAQHVRPPEMG